MRFTDKARGPRDGKRAASTPGFALGGQVVPPGERSRIEIPVAPLYNQAMVSLVAIVVNGTRPGPKLWVSGAIHGDELVGFAVIREILQKLSPEELSGTLVAFPTVNVFGVLHQSRYLPDRRDLNRSFPGSSKGSLAARLAHVFMKEIVGRCTHGIDLHTAAMGRDNLPQVRANLADRETRRLARAFAAPIVIHSNERDGSLRQAATQRGMPTLLYEAGEPLRHDFAAVRIGVEGVLRVLGALGMIRTRLSGKRPSWEAGETTWVRAPRSGYFILETDLGRRVEKGQLVGVVHVRIHEEFFAETRVEIRSPAAGVVIGLARNPFVIVGDAIVHIALTEGGSSIRDRSTGADSSVL